LKIISNKIALSLLFTFYVLALGCQSLPTTLVAKMMDNQQTQETVAYLNQYAQNHVQQKLQVEGNLAYGSMSRQDLDIIYPQKLSTSKLPVVFIVHGGAWVAGNKEGTLPYAKLIADQGFVVVNVEYTLVPQAAYPQQILELNQAVQFVLQQQKQYPIDPDKIFFSGDSAGANIVSTYVAALNSEPLRQKIQFNPALQAEQVRGLILHSGVYDIKSLYHHSGKAGRIISWGTQSVLAQYSGEKQPSDARLDEMSAYPWLNQNYPPVYLSATKVDLLTTSQSLPFIAKLKALHVPVVSQIYDKNYSEQINHDFNFDMRFNASKTVLDQSIKFLKTYSK
jgi:acetyl esterase/lipase